MPWDNYAGFGKGGSSFMAVLKIDNYKGFAPDYITNIVLKENSGNYWESTYFFFEEVNKLSGILKIGTHEIKETVRVYMSDQEPVGLRNPRKMPNIDRDTITLEVSMKSENKVSLKVPTAWIREG